MSSCAEHFREDREPAGKHRAAIFRDRLEIELARMARLHAVLDRALNAGRR